MSEVAPQDRGGVTGGCVGVSGDGDVLHGHGSLREALDHVAPVQGTVVRVVGQALVL